MTRLADKLNHLQLERRKEMVLRPRHFRAMELLVGTDLLRRDVARQVGVSRRTLGRWLKDPAFEAELARRQDAMPCRLDGLRMQTARTLLLNVIRRLDQGEENIPVKEITQLLAQVLSDTAATASAGNDAPSGKDEAVFDLTPDQVERVWAVIDEDHSDDPAAEPEPQPVQAAG